MEAVCGHHSHVAGSPYPVVYSVFAFFEVHIFCASPAGQDIAGCGFVPIAAMMVMGFEDIAEGDLFSELAGMQVLVVGHTDSSPVSKTSYTDNREISAQRALSVTRILEKHGVSPARMMAGACGEYRPSVPNTSAGNMEKNRRVEIYAVDPNVMKPSR